MELFLPCLLPLLMYEQLRGDRGANPILGTLLMGRPITCFNKLWCKIVGALVFVVVFKDFMFSPRVLSFPLPPPAPPPASPPNLLVPYASRHRLAWNLRQGSAILFPLLVRLHSAELCVPRVAEAVSTIFQKGCGKRLRMHRASQRGLRVRGGQEGPREAHAQDGRPAHLHRH